MAVNPTDLFAKMLLIGKRKNIPLMPKLLQDIAMVERIAGIRVNEFIGFGNDESAKLEYFWADSYSLIGELNERNNLHGRGIEIYKSGNFYIRYFKNGCQTIGNYIHIYNGGIVNVGELFMYEDEQRYRYTEYRPDGST